MINGMHRSRNFCQGAGWGGGSRPHGENTALKTYLFDCFLCVFLIPQLILQFTEGSNGFITEKTIYTFPRNQKGSNIFQGLGSNFLRGGGGGGQMLISIEFNITCDFLGVRVRTP